VAIRIRRLLPLAAIAAALLCPASAPAANSNSFYVNAQDDRPASVDASRLSAIASDAARRWSLTVAGNTGELPGPRDGRQVFGFSRSIDRKALGVTTVWTRVRYKLKTSRRCRYVNGKRRCVTVRKNVRVGTEVVEKDVQFNPFVPWEQGPAYPSIDEYDLESTILHELGHFAHPTIENHVFGCENSPMIDSISPGEFWRDSDDWLRFGCSASTGALLKPVAPAGAKLDLLVVQRRLPRVVER
jgi:hypothetical protein